MAIPHSIDNPVFVFHIDVVLLSLFALYVALTLPRSLVRLFQHSEILNGSFLRSGTAPPPIRQHRSHTYDSSGATKKRPIRSTNTSSTVRALVDIPGDRVEGKGGKSSKAQHLTHIIPLRAAAAADTKGSLSRRPAPSPRRPSRVPRWMRILCPTLAYALNFRVAPGVSFGNLLVLLTYAAVILYASLRYPDPLANPWRFGSLAISQVPIAVALAGKTNLLGLACGASYEKV
jgi:ferric-chelate reductase